MVYIILRKILIYYFIVLSDDSRAPSTNNFDQEKPADCVIFDADVDKSYFKSMYLYHRQNEVIIFSNASLRTSDKGICEPVKITGFAKCSNINDSAHAV